MHTNCDERPKRQRISYRIVDIVRSVQTHEATQDGPGTECAHGEGGYVVGAGGTDVDFGVERRVEEAVEGVEPGEEGVLGAGVRGE